MGKKHKSEPSLGRTLIRDRFGANKGRKFVSDNSMLHTTEIQDGYDWGRLNLQSVTEESSFQEFLSTAELAGTEFQAEKLNIKFVNPRSNVGLLTREETKKAKEQQDKHKELLKIPRRPKWDSNTTADELDRNEKEHFLEWRRSLASLQEDKGILLTPYEKNLQFWRQLWRVVERSDVVVQIVDARNPLLFWCEDLEKYVKEVSEDKLNLVLVNKADFLTEQQRKHWADYFSNIGVRVAFFSAVLVSQEQPIEEESEKEEVETDTEEDNDNLSLTMVKKSIENLEQAVEENAEVLNKILGKIDEIVAKTELQNSNTIINSSELLTREQLIDLFKSVHKGPKFTPNVTTIGLVGYPNVGKSSTINALMTCKKVSVSATPGKTKHFQTLFLEKDLLLCDCPGLVMPSFVFTKAEMVLNGILPIDQMRDHVPPTNLVSSLIPRHVIEDKYGIMLPQPLEGEDETRPPTAEELLNAYAYNRGFMTANGQPDNSRAARYILKDYMNGKLLYCHSPPSIPQNEYHTWPERQKIIPANKVIPPRQARAVKPYKTTSEDLDKVFFKTKNTGVHIKGKVVIPSVNNSGSQDGSTDSIVEKPWKKINKHGNKNKKEKLRRVYAHLDQH
ncbi:large subunit GTPase 1 homolog isoform X2 [Aethina tumida]|uniref:large subunit GTPase 1 homolog isoform X2 n=1 Tax=Aethina tumida TaxID=116153 RepID=UPI00096AF5B0|nr:large subunit GTPase 1 homolog isoform X2 [Aethina tumida]